MKTRQGAKRLNTVKPPSQSPNQVKRDIKISNRTPKVKKRRSDQWHQTPGHDDIIFSQHFDSQAVVGWDCNSPDHVRGMRKFSDEEGNDVTDLIKLIADKEELEDDGHNTPPLLGVWKDTVNEDKLLDNNAVHNRLLHKKRRNRKKSGKESSVSQALYEKLSLALDQSEEITKETHELAEDDGVKPTVNDDRSETVALNCSDDLFESATKHVPPTDDTDKTNSASKVSPVNKNHQHETLDRPGTPNDNWSDDEFLDGDDSFIVKATQIPANTKVFAASPVFGVKRKSSNVGDQPKSKCSRFSFQLGDDNNNKTVNKFTNLHTKSKYVASSTSATSSHIGAVTRSVVGITSKANSLAPSLINASSKPIMSSSVNSYSASGKGRQVSVPNTSTVSALSNFYSNKSLQGGKPSSTGGYLHKPHTASTVPLHRPAQNSLSSVSGSGHRFTGPRQSNTCAKTNISNRGSVNNIQSTPNNYKTSMNKGNQFKKHNSFSGPASPSQVSYGARRRSISGDEGRPQNIGRSVGVASVIRPSGSVIHQQSVPNTANLNSNRSSYMPNRQNLNSSVKTCLNNKTSASVIRAPVSISKTSSGTVYSKPPTKPVYTMRNSAVVCSRPTLPVSTIRNSAVVCRPTSTTVTASVTQAQGLPTSIAGKGYHFRNTRANQSPMRMKSASTVSTVSSVKTAANNRSTPVKGHFLDTSLSDDLLCQLAEPDDLLDSQISHNVTITHVDKLDLVTPVTKVLPAKSIPMCVHNTMTSCVASFTKPTEISSKPMCSKASIATLTKQSGPDRQFRFKDSQKPSGGCSKISVSKTPSSTITSTITTAKPLIGDPVMISTKDKKSEKAALEQYSEDLFSDDEDMLLTDDGLTEPQILAMLDEVELLATQQSTIANKCPSKDTMKPTSSGSSVLKELSKNNLESHNQGLSSSQGQTDNQGLSSSQGKTNNPDLSSSQGKTNNQGLSSNQGHTNNQGLSSSQGHTNNQGLSSSQGHTNNQGGLSSSQGHTNNQGLSSSQGQSCSQGISGSQGQLSSQVIASSQNKYSPEEIERKKQLALAKRKNKSAHLFSKK